jgi:ABC-type multidrug transport system ATPase subunit
VNTGKTNTLITLNNVSKKFGSNWIFKHINAQFEAGKKYAVVGGNGSGKSTLLKLLAGIITPNAGTVEFAFEDPYKHVSFSAPYMDLPEELNLSELFNFHENIRRLNISREAFMNEVQLEGDKEIRNYSSGMKQRLKLAFAFFTESEILLLDEPSATLDEHWNEWYLKTVQQVSKDRLVIISSNIPAEYAFCDSVLNIGEFKK